MTAIPTTTTTVFSTPSSLSSAPSSIKVETDLVVTVTPVIRPQTVQCLVQSDIIFLLDNSGSIRDKNPANGSWDNWQLMKDFVVNVVNQANISADGVHVGLITFGNMAITRFSLNQYFQKSDIVNAIRNLQPGNGETNLYAGLTSMRNEFNISRGGRPEVQKIAIVLTDGKFNINEDQTIKVAQDAYLQDGIQIYVIGITDDIDLNQIRNITSPPRIENENYWTTPDFTTLTEVLSSVQKVTCLPDKVIYDACQVKEIVIAFSFPSDVQQWRLLQSFIKNFISGFLPISSTEVRIALVAYDYYTTTTLISLNQNQTEDNIKSIIDSIAFKSGSTANPAVVLKSVKNSVLGVSRDVQQTLILFIGNSLLNPQETFDAAQTLSTLGVRIIAFDILSSLNVLDLRKIGTKTQDSIQSTAYNMLQTKLNQLGDVVCGAQSEITCPRRADIVLLIDQSTSIVAASGGYTNWDLIKDFAARCSESFPITPNLTRMGIVKFSSQASQSTIIPLNRYMSNAEIKTAIMSMSIDGGETNIADALRNGRSLFNPSSGGRSDAPHIIILLTDGKANREAESTMNEANITKNSDITIYTIGVTNQIDENQLKAIASPPSQSHYFYASDFEKLSSILQYLVETSCEKAQTIATTTRKPTLKTTITTKTTTVTSVLPTTTTTITSVLPTTTTTVTSVLPTTTTTTTLPSSSLPTTFTTPLLTSTTISTTTTFDINILTNTPPYVKPNTEPCLVQSEIVFLLDNSVISPSSSSSSNLELMKNFVVNVVNQLNVSSDGVHVGLITIGTPATNKFSLIQYYRVSDIINAIRSVQISVGTTDLFGGLTLMRNMFNNSQGGRPDVRKLAIILTSGKDVTNKDAATKAAQAAYLEDGIQVYAVGITDQIDLDQIKSISSPPRWENDNYWITSDFSTLNEYLSSVQKVACRPEKVVYDACLEKEIVIAFPFPADESKWKNLQNLMKNFISGFLPIGPTSVRIALVSYDYYNINVILSLNKNQSEDEVKTIIDSIPFKSGSTANPAVVLKSVKTSVLSNSRDVQQTLILFIGNALPNPQETYDAAGNLAQLGVRIIAFDVLSSMVTLDLRKIGTKSQDNIQTTAYNMLQTKLALLGDVVCGAQSAITCPRKADVVLLIDQSTSIVAASGGYNNWELMKDFAARAAESFPISPNLTRMGIIQFSTQVAQRTIIPLNKYMSNAEIKAAIMALNLEGGETNIADALRNGRSLFSASNGGRPDVPHLLILITDGKANREADSTMNEATLTKNANITIYTVGVTNQIDENQLKAIASNASYYFYASDFEKLSAILLKLVETSCFVLPPEPTTTRRTTIARTSPTSRTTTTLTTTTTSTTTTTTTTTPTTTTTSTTTTTTTTRPSTTITTSTTTTTTPTTTTTTTTTPTTTTTTPTTTTTSSSQEKNQTANPLISCFKMADVVFVFHNSYNMRADFFRNYLLELAKSVIDQFSVDPTLIRVAAVSFSDRAIVDFYLNNYTTKDAVISAIGKVPYGGYGTNLAAALALVRSSVFVTKNGARMDDSSVSKIVVVILNFASDNQTAALMEADLLKKMGVGIFSVGSGTILNTFELAAMANYPVTKNMATVSTARNLLTLSEPIKNFICNSSATCDPSTCLNGGRCANNNMQCICPAGRSGAKCEKSCSKGGDVVFALDTSRGIELKNFMVVMDFVTRIIQGLDIDSFTGDGSTRSRVGLLTFDGNGINIGWNLNSYASKSQILQSINVPYSGGPNSGLIKALGTANDIMFQPQNGDRSDMPNYLVVITDGDYNENMTADIALWQKAMSLRDNGIKIIGIGLSNSNNYLWSQLVSISNYGEKNALISDFSTLLNYVTSVTDRLCSNDNYCGSNNCAYQATCTSELGTYKCGPCPTLTNGPTCGQACAGEIDLTIMLLSSGVVHRERFQNLTNFAISLVEKLDIAETKTRVALIFWADRAEIAFYLNSFKRKYDVIQAIKLLPYYMGGGNNISGALRLLRRSVFTAGNGDRPNAKNIAVIVVNGPSTVDVNLTIPEAIQSRIDGVFFLPVAVENQLNNSIELESIASHPRSSTLFRVPSFRDLPMVVPSIVNTMCDGFSDCVANSCSCSDSRVTYDCTCQAPFAGKDCKQSCNKRLDVIFLIDISGSTEEEYHRNVGLVREVTYNLPVESDLVRVAVTAYSDDVIGQFFLGQHIRDKRAIINSLDFFSVGGRTNTAAGLDAIINNQINKNGDRYDVPNVVIVITDGESNVNREQTIPKAKTLKNTGATVYVVAVGNSQNSDEIQGIASGRNYTLPFPSSLTISDISSQLIIKLCL